MRLVVYGEDGPYYPRLMGRFDVLEVVRPLVDVAQKARFQCDLVFFYAAHIKNVCCFLPIKEHEHLIRSPVRQGLPRCRVDMGEHDVQILLAHPVQLVLVRYYVPDIVVIVFHMRLLAGLHRVAVDHPASGRAVRS